MKDFYQHVLSTLKVVLKKIKPPPAPYFQGLKTVSINTFCPITLYDNGEKTDDNGEMKEEYVLIKKYTDGGYEDEIMGFYLVDSTSLEVTDEHKTSW